MGGKIWIGADRSEDDDGQGAGQQHQHTQHKTFFFQRCQLDLTSIRRIWKKKKCFCVGRVKILNLFIPPRSPALGFPVVFPNEILPFESVWVCVRHRWPFGGFCSFETFLDSPNEAVNFRLIEPFQTIGRCCNSVRRVGWFSKNFLRRSQQQPPRATRKKKKEIKISGD